MANQKKVSQHFCEYGCEHNVNSSDKKTASLQLILASISGLAEVKPLTQAGNLF